MGVWGLGGLPTENLAFKSVDFGVFWQFIYCGGA